MKTVLVTGGAGYVGSGLVRILLDSGYRVICVDRLLFGGEALLSVWHHEAFELVIADLNDHDRVSAILDDRDVDAVVHLAAIVGDPACRSQPELARATNGSASRHLIDRSVASGVGRFVFASTCSNYGRMPDPDGYVTEETPLAPISLYAELKVEVERYLLQEADLPETFCPVVLRSSTVYGLSPRMRFDLTVNEFAKELGLGRELVVFGQQFWRPYCHVRDLARAIRLVLEAPQEAVRRDVFNVGTTTENYTKGMLVSALQERLPEARISYVEKDEDPRDYRVNSDKIRERLGFHPSLTVPQGLDEILHAVQTGVFADPDADRYHNSPPG